MNKNIKDKINFKVILFYISVGLLILYLIEFGSFGFYYTTEESSRLSYAPRVGSVKFLIGFQVISLFLICIIVFKETLKYRFVIPFLNRMILYFLIGMSLFYSLYTVLTESVQSLLLETSSCFVYLFSIAIFIGFDEELWNRARKLMYYVGVLSIIMSFYYVLKFGSTYVGTVGNSKQIIYLSTGFFPLAIWALCYEQYTSLEKITAYMAIIISMLVAVIYATRGWALQSMILLFAYHYKNRKKSKIGNLTHIAIFFVFFGIISIFLFHVFSESTEYIIGRIFQDTRSRQFVIIFDGFRIQDFLIGKGVNGTYVTDRLTEYKYIDNTFMFLIFHYGIFFAFAYFLFIIKSILSCFRYNKNGVIILSMYLMALNGVSVFFSQTIDLKCLFIFMLIGRCYKLSFVNDYRNRQAIIKRRAC